MASPKTNLIFCSVARVGAPGWLRRCWRKPGFAECYVIDGGASAWTEAGLPVNRGIRRVISLERQVRIAAGSVVLAGVLLAQFVHAFFMWLSGSSVQA